MSEPSSRIAMRSRSGRGGCWRRRSLGWGAFLHGMPFKLLLDHSERCGFCLPLQGQLPGGAPGPSTTAGDLPPDLLPAVLRWLDHDSLFCALQACKAWHAAGCSADAGDLWEEQFTQRGWLQRPQQQQQQVRTAGGGPLAGPQQPGGAPPPQPQQAADGGCRVDWRRRYREHYSRCCYECFRPTERHTLLAGSLRVRLCQPCSSSHVSHRPHHRLMSATAAKQRCCLRDAGAPLSGRRVAQPVFAAQRESATVGCRRVVTPCWRLLCLLCSLCPADLAGLPHCVEPNPVQAAFLPMTLYRSLDVRRAALRRWGSWQVVQAERRRRLTR